MTAPRAPHLVWLCCDQLRADALGFMGNPHVRTPHLDRLASRGAVFENLFPQSPVCVTSRACMLTGRYVRNVGMANGSPLMPPTQVTIAEWLQRQGYGTALCGKLHLTPQQYTRDHLHPTHPISDAAPFLAAAGLPPLPADPAKRNYGYQEEVSFEDALQGTWHDWLRARDPALAERAAKRQLFRPAFRGKCLGDVGTLDLPSELHPSMFLAERACEVFRRRHADGPLHLKLSFVDPHHPWDPPADLAATYDPATMPLPRYRDTGAIVWPPLLRQRAADYSGVTDEMARTTIAYYYAMIELIDRAIGQLVATIAAAGELEHTIFVFVADHGEFLGDYGLWRKGSYHYDCLLRVPSFIVAPGQVPAGQRIAGLVQAIDLAPTLLSLAGLPIYPGMQGRDWSAELRAAAPIGRPWVYCEMYTAQWGPFINCWTLRTPTAKLNYYCEERVGHLFDLAADPDERRDLWDDPAARPLRDTMMANLLQELASQADPLPKVLSQY